MLYKVGQSLMSLKKNSLYARLETMFLGFITILRTALIALPVLSVSLSVNAEDEWWSDMDLYLGAGLGQSSITPYHITSKDYYVVDRSRAAWKLTGGLDVNDYISIEGYYSDLGSTKLSSDSLDDADIGYRMAGADMILHYWAEGEERLPGSIALYAKAGLNHTDTYHSNNIEENDGVRKLFAGLGAEVYLQQGFSVRFEVESYNADASLLSLNLVKRFGFNSKKLKKDKFITMIEQLPETAAGPRIAFLVPVVLDSDLDGILDDEDQCPDSIKSIAIDEFGCNNLRRYVNDIVSQVEFNSDSESLTQASHLELDKVINLLITSTAINVEVQVHGDASHSDQLSQKRAESIASYLTEKGIASDRVSAVGDDEEQPLVDDHSSTGSEQNKKVELILTTL